MKYGNWTIISEAGTGSHRKRLVLARCKCGREKNVRLGNLKSGISTQCSSCSKKGRTPWNRVHGDAISKPAEYLAWRGMNRRCEYENSPSWNRYGGIGIRVCDRWKGANGYVNFLSDMGRRPSANHSVDRVDNNGGYSPENCRWATREEQGRNKSSNRILAIRGRSMTLVEWTEYSRYGYGTIHGRLRKGWSDEDAVFRDSPRPSRTKTKEPTKELDQG